MNKSVAKLKVETKEIRRFICSQVRKPFITETTTFSERCYLKASIGMPEALVYQTSTQGFVK